MLASHWLNATGLSVLLCAVAGTSLAATPSTAQQALRQYVSAENTFDLKRLDAVLGAQFVEISPLGQVDTRAAVLSFYAPHKKVAAPPVTLSEIVLHTQADVAVMTTEISYRMGERNMTLAIGAVAQHAPSGWTLLSVQYTPIRPKQNTP
ncbi:MULTISPECIES: nuclear transport factor 2 family protein [Xanthomonas]|uniref:nuclear transport factor 2 family protein n=1 Tax=Xanthomonas TaxID=338 RepID=UPI001374F575|nr:MULTISPECIES: nuclear transport factor 2 family protein [Xanthomonas]